MVRGGDGEARIGRAIIARAGTIGKGRGGYLIWERSLPYYRKGRGGLSDLGGEPFLPVASTA